MSLSEGDFHKNSMEQRKIILIFSRLNLEQRRKDMDVNEYERISNLLKQIKSKGTVLLLLLYISVTVESSSLYLLYTEEEKKINMFLM